MTRARTAALGWLCVLSIGLLYGRLYFGNASRLYSHTPIYRSQALAFLQGRASLPVDFSCASAEMILYKGRLYYYYGPLPAFVHAVFIFAARRITGRTHFLPEPVMTFFAVCGFAAVIYMAFSAKGRALGRSSLAAGLIGWSAALAVCGLSIFFSVARYRLLILEEAVLYSTALGGSAVLLVYLHLLRWRQGEPYAPRTALAASLCCAGAMLCRPNYATYALLLTPWMMIPHLRQNAVLYRLLRGSETGPPGAGWGEGKAIRRGVVFLAAPALAIAFLLAYNYVRFEEPTEFGTRYLLTQRPQDARAVSFGSDVKRLPFPARLIDSVQGYLTGYDNPLFFSHRGPVAGRGFETQIMQVPFTFQRVPWIWLPLFAALLWHISGLTRAGPKNPLARADLVFLLLGAAIVGQHLWLSTDFRDIVYRYALDMVPGFLAIALAGIGFSGSYIAVSVLLAVAFVADAPQYVRVWLHGSGHYLMLGAAAEPFDARCTATAIPAAIACGPQLAQVHPRARVGWRPEDDCGMSSTLFFVFSVDQPAGGWRC
jgi:hypothetical protein